MEGGGFLQVLAVVSLVSPNLPVVRPNTKSAQCRNPSLGLATKARGCKVEGQVGDPGAFHMLPGVQKM